MFKFRNHIALLLFLLLPILVVTCCMILNDFALKLVFKEFLFNSAVLVINSVIVSLITNKWFNKIAALFLFIPFYVVLLVKIFTLINFFNFIDNAVLYTVFETNTHEIANFFDSYIAWHQILLASIYFVVLLYIIFSFSEKLKIKNQHITDVLILISIAVMYRFYERSLTLLTVDTFATYKTYSAEMGEEISKPTSNYFKNVVNTDDEALYVVIIGESATRNNMGVYGYYRDTNPKLKKLTPELYLFNDVISPHIQTILSLDKILSMGNHQAPQNNKLGSVIQLANQAGFETYWLSNQKPIGAYESLVSQYAKASKHQFYVSNLYDDKSKFDEILLPKLQKTIEQPALKKMIFLHLEGSHISYHTKYPEHFNYFKSQPKSNFKTDEAYQIINQYDNAIRYNDFIISEIISKVKSTNKNSYVVYFSDHGEEVFNDYEYFGHHESIGSKAMFEIPFIVWLSDKYKQQSKLQLQYYIDRKYNLEDFIYSFSELSRIKFDQFDATKSIFSANFQSKKRIVLKDVDYDQDIK